MRLRKIKLAGFKSFVDPTTLLIPGNLTGIVGPNGSGKSNIIDAVMWVMGESSAKYLRGDALTDVIFNGSSTRNPVGQASVELIFDNTEKKLGGQYASYDEISIKRQINRDAISNYFLNGARCRRRDIQSLFLGTGLGPRSYSIIEQGTISRLIEAKPDELRTFIEEAAGISKYRERRRETENSIRHTRENIARLNDIRGELESQLKHLHRQARAAERYQVLKKEQRQLEAEMLALNWRDLKQQSEREQEQVRKYETRVEAAIAELRKIENSIVQERDKLAAANETFNNAQSGYYQIGGEISQLEQKLHHSKEKIADTEQELERNRQEENTVHEHLLHDKSRLGDLQETRTGLEPELQGSRDESDKAYYCLNESEKAMQSWQTEWETFNTTMSEYAGRVEVEQTRLQHLETAIEETTKRQVSLQRELEEIDRDSLLETINTNHDEINGNEKQFSGFKEELAGKRKLLQKARDEYLRVSQQLDELRLAIQKQEGRLASLEALQQSASGDNNAVGQWLKNTGLSDFPRLAQQVNVDAEWARAVEIVLSRYLQDICVDDLSDYKDHLLRLSSGHAGIVSNKEVAGTGKHKRPVLADKIKGKFPLKHLLADIYIANSDKDVLDIQPLLRDGETVITAGGTWAGVNWIRVYRDQVSQAGTLSREKEIKQLKQDLVRSRQELLELEKKTLSARELLEQTETELNNGQLELAQKQEQLAGFRTSLATSQARLEQADNRSERISEELESLQEQLDLDNAELENVRTGLSRVKKQHDDLEKQRQELIQLRDKHRLSLTNARQQWQKTHEQSHGIALQLESISSQTVSLEQSIKRGQLQVSHIQNRRTELEKILADSQAPLQDIKSDLENRLKDKVRAEKLLGDARLDVQQLENTLRNLEHSRNGQEERVQEQRDLLEKERLGTQECRVRLQTIEEKLNETGKVPAEILKTLDETASMSGWREQLDKVMQKIDRLGPINLAAIDEYNQLSERKSYLDKQDEDLREALATLENAIRKIDKESRARFRETFNQINANLEESFPHLFGGGHACLELIGEDLLETGVTIMARPPGKRNSTIHLLSGGEKALTAVALVFSIFRLNPAPFCILDEVDAPLDDANINRFSELVTAMSEDVQFIVITHNKITMEISHQLLGVTMQEAGVSRMVSVDVDEAVRLAATA